MYRGNWRKSYRCRSSHADNVPHVKGTLKDEKGSEGWLALTALQWRCVTGFTRSQYNDAISSLKRDGLIESRRRRLSYKDCAAITWLRLTAKAKSETAEIMARPGISAFAEIPHPPISDNSENVACAISAQAESLIEMNFINNENNCENVILDEIKISSTFNKEKSIGKGSKSSSAEKTKKYLSNKDWFNITIKQVYADTGLSSAPYTTTSAKSLTGIVEYLDTNLGEYFAHCPDGVTPSIYALNLAVRNWDVFGKFCLQFYGAYSVPSSPQLWAVNEFMLKPLPDFIHFEAYLAALEHAKEVHGNQPSLFLSR